LNLDLHTYSSISTESRSPHNLNIRGYNNKYYLNFLNEKLSLKGKSAKKLGRELLL